MACYRVLPLARFHSRLDPIDALDTFWRLHSFDRIIFDVPYGDLAIHCTRAAIRGARYCLVALAELHHYLAAGRVERLVFKDLDDVISSSRSLCLRFFISCLQPEKCLRDAVSGVIRVYVCALLVDLAQPVVQRAFLRIDSARAARSDDGAVRNAARQSMQIRFAGHENELAAREQIAGRGLQHEGFQVSTPQAGMNNVGVTLQ